VKAVTRIVRTASAKADRPQPLPPAKRSHTTQLPMISSWDTIIDRGGGSDGRQVCDVAPLQDGQERGHEHSAGSALVGSEANG
jgi:hypothetical protein